MVLALSLGLRRLRLELGPMGAAAPLLLGSVFVPSKAGFDEGLLSLSLFNLLYIENPYR